MTVKHKTKGKAHDVLKLRSTVRKALNEQRRWAYLKTASDYGWGGGPAPFAKLAEYAEQIREYTMNGVAPVKITPAPGTVTTITRDGRPF